MALKGASKGCAGWHRMPAWVQEHCQAWDDAVQHVLLSLQNTIGSVTPSLEFGDFCEKHWHYSYPTL